MTREEVKEFSKDRLKKEATKYGGFKKLCEDSGVKYQAGLYYQRSGRIVRSALHSFARKLNVNPDYLLGKANEPGAYSIISEEAPPSVVNFVQWIYSDQDIFSSEYLAKLNDIQTLLTDYAADNNIPKLAQWTAEYHLFCTIIKAINEDKAHINLLYQLAENATYAGDNKILEAISNEQLHIAE